MRKCPLPQHKEPTSFTMSHDIHQNSKRMTSKKPFSLFRKIRAYLAGVACVSIEGRRARSSSCSFKHSKPVATDASVTRLAQNQDSLPRRKKAWALRRIRPANREINKAWCYVSSSLFCVWHLAMTHCCPSSYTLSCSMHPLS